MASNGGTLHGVPQQQQQSQHHTCSHCGLFFESSSSLQVHMHYHHENMNHRWGPPLPPPTSTASSTTPTSDTENNNHPGGTGGATKQQQQQQQQHHAVKAASSPHQTIAAAADSSDNQPPTPQPAPQSLPEPGTPQSYTGGVSPYQQQQQQQQQQQTGTLPLVTPDMHYPTYIHGYDPYPYHAAAGTLDYGGNPLPPPPPPQQQTAGAAGSHLSSTTSGGGGSSSTGNNPTEYKAVPSARYHPYGGGNGNGATQNAAPGGGGGGGGTTVQIANHGLSPQVVSSSNASLSGTQNLQTTTSANGGSGNSGSNNTASTTTSSPPQNSGAGHIPPTPSPSPIQCEKCGLVCDSDEVLHEHDSAVHQQSAAPGGTEVSGRPQDDMQQQQQYHQYHHQGAPSAFIKEEPPASDILDLDSQKMVYTPTDGGVLPPMNSLHPLQSMQRHPMAMWTHDPHNFMVQPHHPGHDLKSSGYYHHHPSMKPEYVTAGMAQHGGPMHVKSEYGPIVAPAVAVVKNEYSIAPTLPLPPAVAPQPNPSSVKQYTDELGDNQLATSPSDFPSTTTPQESGTQYRTFEPPTSSLPNSALPTKGTAWKSNEARRPKTYNCTACNKWFTSSGHLKRHYNTTLHKNAVKSSGQPDPATLPISVHHHPGRDPNHANKGRRGGSGGGGNGAQIQTPIQQPIPPPEPPRSPEYGTQYGLSGFTTPPGHHQLGGGHHQVGFHQYNPNLHHVSSVNGNGSNSNSNTSSAVPPNGVAGPSVQVSQPRGLQIYSNNHLEPLPPGAPQSMAVPPSDHTTEPQQQPPPTQPIITTTTTITTIPTTNIPSPPLPPQPLHNHSTVVYHQPITSPLTINTNIPSFQTILPEAPSYHHIIGNPMVSLLPVDMVELDQVGHQAAHLTYLAPTTAVAFGGDVYGLVESSGFPRYAGGASEIYQGDTAPPFSPNVPEQYHQQQQQQRNGIISTTTTSMGTTIITMAADSNGNVGGGGGSLKYNEQPVTEPQLAATAPSISPAPCSPSVTSTGGASSSGSDTPMLTGASMVATSANGHNGTGNGNRNGSSSGGSPVAEVHRCIECDKVFNKACYLTQHNKTFHCGDKPYKCHRCGKRFPCDQSHEEHLAKHGGEKPFKCELCPKQFNHKTDLRRHMCLHSGSKPYACDHCGKGFIRKDHMLKHSETHRRNFTVTGGSGGTGKKQQQQGSVAAEDTATTTTAATTTTVYGKALAVGGHGHHHHRGGCSDILLLEDDE